jgi:hypothetical protein
MIRRGSWNSEIFSVTPGLGSTVTDVFINQKNRGGRG